MEHMLMIVEGINPVFLPEDQYERIQSTSKMNADIFVLMGFILYTLHL